MKATARSIFVQQQEQVLAAVPLFVFMGVMLEKSRLAEDLLEEAFLAAAGRFAQLAHQQFQQSGGRQVGQVQIDRLPPRPVQLVQEPFQQGRFSHTAGAGDQGDRGLLGQVAKPGESLLHAIVLPEGRRRDTLGERL